MRVLCLLALAWSFQVSGTVITVTNTQDTGPGSLRAAILTANNTPSPSEIRFNLPGAGVQTIAPVTPLPEITNTVIIDGFSQPGTRMNAQIWGNDAVLQIRLDGVTLSNSFSPALTLKAGGCLVRGLILVRFPYGIRIDNSSHNTIAGNRIGVDWDGVARGMTFGGIEVTCLSFGAAMFNLIGGPTPADRNVIGGNRTGISFFPTTAANNVVQGNFIGTDASGRLPRGNIFEAISIQAATNILIKGNVLSASTGAGGCGVRLTAASGSSIVENDIGHGAASWTDLGNFENGISAQGSSQALVDANYIGFNHGYGISLLGCDNFTIRNNRIGTAGSGAEPYGNLKGGISLQNSSSNLLSQNEILFNGGSGIGVNSGRANRITANQLFDNAGLGIDLNIDFDANDAQSAPSLTGAVSGNGNLRVTGNLESAAPQSYRIEVFVSDAWDPWGSAEGQVYVGWTNVVTDGFGGADFAVQLPFQPWTESDLLVTATATDPAGNTSEFSTCTLLRRDPEPPRLTSAANGTMLTFCWPAAAAGYTLEATDALALPFWQPVTSGIVTQGLNLCFSITNTTGKPQQYFRLRK